MPSQRSWEGKYVCRTVEEVMYTSYQNVSSLRPGIFFCLSVYLFTYLFRVSIFISEFEEYVIYISTFFF